MQMAHVRRDRLDLIAGQDDRDEIAVVHDRPHRLSRIEENSVTRDKMMLLPRPTAHDPAGS
ncbi:hypothetical protein ASG40_19860 [Methylobacterium sp. Leaf399]|nr:hypothetical protein ASF39_19945 [Methylobacterium sp. Leaf108]KQT13096.1 hypothetical protein ASG40_19860 [Methylobacterium sp. Leaf399]